MVHIYSQITGRLVALYVRPGQEVTKGQTIGLIQSSEISEARADYDKAKIEVARSDRQLDRAKLLLQHEVMAQRDYDDLEAADQAAHSELTFFPCGHSYDLMNASRSALIAAACVVGMPCGKSL